MIVTHGNVISQPAVPHPSYSRYVAVLDVLGMKAWLEKESAQAIAEALHVALVACGQSSCGKTPEGVTYGPLVEVIHFSDSLIAWSPDDSWASLGVLCSSLNLIVGVALTHGVPLRGSIALGDVVCNHRTLKFVGQPIAEAYSWSEKNRPFRSVGVDITPQTILKIISRMITDPIPSHWQRSIDENVIRHEREAAGGLIWHADCLFVNHWSHGMFLRADPTAMFLKRQLPIPTDEENSITDKLRELREFHSKHQQLQACQWERPFATSSIPINSSTEEFSSMQSDCVYLDGLRKVRS